MKFLQHQEPQHTNFEKNIPLIFDPCAPMFLFTFEFSKREKTDEKIDEKIGRKLTESHYFSLRFFLLKTFLPAQKYNREKQAKKLMTF